MKPVLPRSLATDVALNQKGVYRMRRRPLTGVWHTPHEEDDPDHALIVAAWPGDSPIDPPPSLINSWKQPADETGLEKFSYHWHADGSLETKGHLDAVEAETDTIAIVLPPSFWLPNDQYFHTTITDTDDESFTLARVYFDSLTGEMTISWPAVDA